MKKILIASVFLFSFGITSLLGIIGFSLLRKIVEVENRGEISNRAEEFLAEQKATDSEQWRFIDLSEKDEGLVLGAQTYEIGNCLKVTIPFEVKNDYSERGCGHFFAVANPHGSIYVYQKEVNFEKIDEDSGVMLRRKEKENYEESNFENGGRNFLIFTKVGENSREKVAFYLKRKRMTIVSWLNDSSEDIPGKFEDILRSLEILK